MSACGENFIIVKAVGFISDTGLQFFISQGPSWVSWDIAGKHSKQMNIPF